MFSSKLVSEKLVRSNNRQFKSRLHVRGYPDTLVEKPRVEKVLLEVKFEEPSKRESRHSNKKKNAQENFTFSHTIPPNGAQSLFPKVSHLTLSPGGGKMRDPGNGVEFKKILMSKWHLIQNQPLLREIYKEPPVISYKRVKSLKDILVQSKL